MSPDCVIELTIDEITCRNLGNIHSPLDICFSCCGTYMLIPKAASPCKIVFNKGKRIKAPFSLLQDLVVSFRLLSASGENKIRGQSTFDLGVLVQQYERGVPTIYRLEIGLQQEDGRKFGVIYCSFQVMSEDEFVEALANKRPISASSSKSPPRARSSRRDAGGFSSTASFAQNSKY